MLSDFFAVVPSKLNYLFTASKPSSAAAVSSRKRSSRTKHTRRSAPFQPTALLTPARQSTRMIVNPVPQPLLAPLVGPLTLADYYEDFVVEVEKQEEVTAALEEAMADSSSSASAVVERNSGSATPSTPRRKSFISISTAHPALFSADSSTPELPPLLLGNGPRLPSTLAHAPRGRSFASPAQTRTFSTGAAPFTQSEAQAVPHRRRLASINAEWLVGVSQGSERSAKRREGRKQVKFASRQMVRLIQRTLAREEGREGETEWR